MEGYSCKKEPSDSTVHNAKNTPSPEPHTNDEWQHPTAANADSRDLTKMGNVVVTLKVMPASPDADSTAIQQRVKELIRSFVDEKHKDAEIRVEEEPIGFGIKAHKFTFAYDESMGSTETLEENINKEENIESVETIDVRRAIG